MAYAAVRSARRGRGASDAAWVVALTIALLAVVAIFLLWWGGYLGVSPHSAPIAAPAAASPSAQRAH